MALAFTTACGATADSDAVPGRYTLTAEIGRSDGLLLDSGLIVPVTPPFLNQADINLHLGMAFSLQGPGSGMDFCAKDEGYQAVGDIPTETGDCTWNHVFLGGNAFEERGVDRDGYILRDRDGDLHRVLVLEHDIEPGGGGFGTATFDVLAVE
jgi:hypothetical protein